MDLVNHEVIHGVFGKGNVVNCDDSYIKINFKSGDKRFVFPDVFKKHIKFIDQKAANMVKEKMEIKEKELKELELILKEERAIEQERLRIEEQIKKMKNGKINPKIQSVFWCKNDEEDLIFQDWKIFTGKIKSGKKQGEPRQFARMNSKSTCLLTRREDDVSESDRQILGLFMVEETFDGRTCEDGYILAHQEYKIKLTEDESKKMLFWNYYVDKKFPEKTVWNSGRQRYFDNLWMAQILRDIVSLRSETKEKEEAKKFFEYFCDVNLIDKNGLPEAEGALLYTEE